MATAKIASEVTRLAGQLDEITRIVRFEPALLALRDERVSHWSIALQVDHILKVLEVGQRVFTEPSAALPRGMNLLGHFVLATGWFPRGFARSPKAVLPAEQSPADLAQRTLNLRRIYCEKPLPDAVFANPKPVFPHPFFGGLSAVRGLRFLGIHTHHHLKIVGDIRRAG